ncbi:MAG: hypothetical protein KIS83_02390 [Rubrivivax sp.]|nr:hypothetical protein [Rubrivivax sp.]MCW5609528.1 hypothetical protein [Rubrivivax sp.]
MRKEVTVAFGPAGTVVAALPAGEADWPADQARRWLDERFVELECEPLRASGKLLNADKVLAVAAALGRERLEADEALRGDYARAVTAALGRPLVRVDVDALAVTF